MPEQLTIEQRSTQMKKVRGQNNRSTEGAVEQALIANGIENWEKHPDNIIGKPDFIFPHHKLLVFVDGCFWHSCPICKRRLPVNHAEFWRNKIDGNRRRDNRLRRKLRQEGYHVMRIWEHEVKSGKWIKRIRGLLQRIEAVGNL
jgi:DNA mismatch endonuclease (patch repair protein)